MVSILLARAFVFDAESILLARAFVLFDLINFWDLKLDDACSVGIAGSLAC